jgi:hypothetical protein
MQFAKKILQYWSYRENFNRKNLRGFGYLTVDIFMMLKWVLAGAEVIIHLVEERV